MNDNIKQCPSCNARAEDIEIKAKELGTSCYIICTKCGAFAINDTLKEVLNDWNNNDIIKPNFKKEKVQ